MEDFNHTFRELFEQLGLPSDADSIERWIREHQGLDRKVHLWAAEFWAPAQAEFIHEALEEDSDWAELVDQLDARLRG